MGAFILALLSFVTISAAAQAQPAMKDETGHAHDLIAALVGKDFPKVEAQFDEKMKAALPSGRMQTMWETLLMQVGAYKSCAAQSRVRVIADKQMVITACEFERAPLDLQFAFDSESRISGMAMRPVGPAEVPYTLPSYATPASYTEQGLTIGSGEWALPATLDMPLGPGPFPLVVLVHGSGPDDRDETVGAEKPFRDLGVGLASRGIAVLRYDKRTKVYAEKLRGALPTFTVKEEMIDDAHEAVKTARSQPKIDPARIYVLGHSLGGMLIPRIAAADSRLAGVIVMAGLVRPLDQMMLEQVRYLAMADGTISPAEQKAIDEASANVQAINALKPEDANSGRMVGNAPASYWLDLRGYDPPSAATALKQPMLILQGERDYQVPMDEFAKWKAALSDKPSVTFRSYSALNHLFIAGRGKSLPAEYQIAGHVDEAVIRDIADWIKK
ncbi:MAG TPA: alpha/beta fold hydrolase [Vicinamibacterales bacterium]|nr:alpha/beta fold hydrolase [Vicinamibacterales bacterium]